MVVRPVSSPLIDSSYKTPLQIFSNEVMAAARKRLPNLDNAQLQKIVIDKWAKMTDREKQVYRTKSLAYAKTAAQARLAAARSAVSSESAVASSVTTSLGPTKSTVLAPRFGGAPTSSGAGVGGNTLPSDGGNHSPVAKLPEGWRRTLIQRNMGEGAGGSCYEVCLHTPTGERLRTKAELASYKQRHKLTDISEDVFQFKRTGNLPIMSKALVSGVIRRPGPTIFRPGPASVPVAPGAVVVSSSTVVPASLSTAVPVSPSTVVPVSPNTGTVVPVSHSSGGGSNMIKLAARVPSNPTTQPAVAPSEKSVR